MTGTDIVTEVRSVVGDIVDPYKHSDDMYLQWVIEAVNKVLLARPDAYTGYASSDIVFDIASVSVGSLGATLQANNKFRLAVAGWVIHKAGLNHRNMDLANAGLLQYKDGLEV